MNPNQDNSSDRERPEDVGQEDLYIQQLFDAHLNIDPPETDYVERLSRQLDAEFASVMSAVDASNGAHTQNGHSAEYPTVDLASAKASRDSNDRSGSFSRWFGGVVAAAILLGMFAFWTVQPPASWAEMIEALKSAPWVQTDSGRTSSWISSSNQVLARRDVDQTTFASRSAGTYLNFVRDEAKIYQSDPDRDWRPMDQQLIAWLADSANKSIDPDAEWKIVSESAARVDDAAGRWLKLAVVFESVEPEAEVFTAVFTIDPETKMPVSCQVHEGSFRLADSESGGGWQSVSFDYPSEGPADIYELGVASNTQIVQLGVDSEAALVSTNVAPDIKELPVNELAVSKPKPDLKPSDDLKDLVPKDDKDPKAGEPKLSEPKLSEPTLSEPKVAKAAKPTPAPDARKKNRFRSNRHLFQPRRRYRLFQFPLHQWR